MNKILGKNALAVLLIIFLCCITFSVGACDPTFSEYSGEYKELYSAAIQSILGVWSDTSDEIFVLEKDEYVAYNNGVLSSREYNTISSSFKDRFVQIIKPNIPKN